MLKYHSLVWLFLVISATCLYSQGLNDWQTITYMNDVSDLLEADNKIWVATTGGIYAYDPQDSLAVRYTNNEGLRSLNLTSIEKDQYGAIFAATRDGNINRYLSASDSWEVYPDLRGEQIVDLFVLADTLWVATNSGVGVYLINPAGLEFRDYYNNLPIRPKQANRVQVFDDHLYYATDQGLLVAPSDFIRNNLKISAAWQVLTDEDGLPANDILDIVATEDSLLIGTNNGAASVDRTQTIKVIQSWTFGVVRRIMVDGSDIWFIRYTDYFKRVGDLWARQAREEKTINSGIIASDNNIWLGLAKGGLKKSSWGKSYLLDGPASNHVGTLMKDRQGRLWICSGKFKVYFGEGFYRYDFQNWTNYRFAGTDWTRKNQTVTVYEDMTGKIWLGAWGGGITILDNNSVDYLHAWAGDGSLTISGMDGKEEIVMPELAAEKRACIPPAQVQAQNYTVNPFFVEDDQGNLWIVNYLAKDPDYIIVIPRNGNGQLQMDCTDWIYFGGNLGMSLGESEISSLVFDDFGRLWMGTFANGILIFDYNGTIDNLNDDLPLTRVNVTNANLFSNTILSLDKDRDGIIWIGTAGGLNSFDGQNFYKHVGEVGPIENKINQVFIDNYNNKWFATDGGLSILKADVSPWQPFGWVHYTEENSGLPDKVVNSIFVDSERSEAYIGTESGLAIFSGPYAEYKTDFSSVVAGPSPFIMDGQTDFTIKNLAFGSSVKILNVNGKLVRMLTTENGGIEGGRASWDGMNLENRRVSSGIYLYLIYTDEGISGSGKIAVINK